MFVTSSDRGGFFYDWEVSLPVQLAPATIALPPAPNISTKGFSTRKEAQGESEKTLANEMLTEKKIFAK